jgi:hypothetical protein
MATVGRRAWRRRQGCHVRVVGVHTVGVVCWYRDANRQWEGFWQKGLLGEGGQHDRTALFHSNVGVDGCGTRRLINVVRAESAG